MNSNKQLRKELKFGKVTIRLYDVIDPTTIPYEGNSNITAYDTAERVLWQAEAPKTHYDSYFDINVDASNGMLIAISSCSYRYSLSLEDGKIKDYHLIK